MFAIKVEKINEDGSRTPFTLGCDRNEINADGLVILGITPDNGRDGINAMLSIVNTSIARIATAISGSEELMKAARLAVTSAIFKEIGRENENAAE